MMLASSSISNSNQKFIRKTLLFLLVLIAVDFSVGKLFEVAYFSQKTGKFHRTVMAMETTKADILIFGSSRAIHHYDSRVFEGTLGVSTYNVGARGQDIVYSYAVLKSVLQRYRPKLILLNIDTRLFNREGKFERLSDLAPFYRNHSEIRSIIERKSRFENVKLLSSLYAYNSTLLHWLNYQLTPQVDYQGFIPLTGVADLEGLENSASGAGDLLLDQDYQQYYEAFLDDCSQAGVKVIVSLSPSVIYIDNTKISAIMGAIDLATKRNVPVWDYTVDTKFLQHGELFSDYAHLNGEGARLFSELVAERLKTESGS